MSTQWHAPAQPPPEYHDDPSLGGPPLASPDGHWWWDGRHWVPLTDPVQPAA
jgi:hypothetical protein